MVLSIRFLWIILQTDAHGSHHRYLQYRRTSYFTVDGAGSQKSSLLIPWVTLGDVPLEFIFQHIWVCGDIQFFLHSISPKWLTFKTSILNPLSDVGPSGICRAWTKASVNCCTTGKIRTLAAPWLQTMQAQVNTRYRTPNLTGKALEATAIALFWYKIEEKLIATAEYCKVTWKLFQTSLGLFSLC